MYSKLYSYYSLQHEYIFYLIIRRKLPISGTSFKQLLNEMRLGYVDVGFWSMCYTQKGGTHQLDRGDIERGCEVDAGELIHTLIVACYFKVELRKLTQAIYIMIYM